MPYQITKPGHFALKPGTLVKVQHCANAYALPSGINAKDCVKILEFDHGYYRVEQNGRTFSVFITNIIERVDQTANRRLVKNGTDSVKLSGMVFDRELMREKAAELAAKGVYLGTSSWKYEGWCGMLYNAAQYQFRGKFARTRFNDNCLAEYAQVFKTVCVDAAYYSFPTPAYLQTLADAVPSDFRFGFKITDTLTIKKFPNLPRFGAKAGQLNRDFLNAELFATAFLKPSEAIREKVGVLMFEFSQFWQSDYQHGRDFVKDLDGFLSKLPKNWPYAIEMRNAHWLQDEYFDCLARNGVTHVFNSWQAMPAVSEQIALPKSQSNPDLVAARFLLTPGRKYEDSVKAFAPYDKIHEVNEDARKAAASLISESLRYEPRRKTYVYVNNRLEGNALQSLEAIVRLLHEV